MTQPGPQALTSPLLQANGFVHAFFTRNGGVSGGAFSSLNAALTLGDAPECVEANLNAMSRYLGVQADRLMTVTQVHGAAVVLIDQEGTSLTLRDREADALVTAQDDTAVAVRTADCVPILVGCPRTGACAAVHAGWRGLTAGVISNAIAALLRNGADLSSLVAAVGPCIGVECFEVSEEIAAQLAEAAPDCRPVHRTFGAKPHVDLGLVAATQLHAAGLPPQAVDVIGRCTFMNSKDFFSYRRDGKSSGRQLSAIRSGSFSSSVDRPRKK